MRVQLQIGFATDPSPANFTSSDAPVPTQSNVSNIDTFYKSDTPKGFRGFQLSATRDKPVSILDGTYKFFDKYPGFLSKVLSDDDGDFLGYVHIPIVIIGRIPEVLYIGFDTVTSEHAVDFYLSGNETGLGITIIGNTSPVVAVKLADLGYGSDSTYAVVVLQIRKWSKPNASIKLTMCTSDYTAVYNTHDLHEVIASRNSRETQLNIVPGIITQYLDATIYDRFNTLRNFALQDLLLKNLKISAFAIDNDDTMYLLGDYVIQDWHVSGNSSKIEVTSSDPSAGFENIQVAALNIAPRSIHQLLQIAFVYANVPWKYSDTVISSICTSCVVPDSWHTACSLKEFIHDICTLGMLSIYWDKNTFVVGGCY